MKIEIDRIIMIVIVMNNHQQDVTDMVGRPADTMMIMVEIIRDPNPGVPITIVLEGIITITMTIIESTTKTIGEVAIGEVAIGEVGVGVGIERDMTIIMITTVRGMTKIRVKAIIKKEK